MIFYGAADHDGDPPARLRRAQQWARLAIGIACGAAFALLLAAAMP